MKISKLIEELQKKLAEHGDVETYAWQHPEEERSWEEISSIYFNETKKVITIS